MSLLGLPLASLLAIGGAVAALTLVLYVLKLRRRPVAVPFSPIWQRLLRDKEASQLFSQLKRWLSLLLQLLIVALLVFALGDPRPTGNVIDGRHVVVLVDTSVSMNARDVRPSRLGVAQRKLRDIISGLSGSDHMLLAQMDASITPLTPMTDDIGVLRDSLDKLRTSDTRADLVAALRFAIDALQDSTRPEVIVVSDGALGDASSVNRDLEGIKLSYVPVGAAGQNVAITQFAVRRYPLDKSRYEVMLEATNTGDNPVEVELSLLGDGNVVDVSRLALKPGERLPRFYEDLAGADRTLEAKLSVPSDFGDDLASDNRAFALLPERRRVRVLVVTSGNTYLEAALLLDEYLDVTLIAPGDYPHAESFDVAIFDNVAPPLEQRYGSALYLNPPGDQAPVPHGRAIEDFGFDVWDKKAPVLQFIAPENIQVAQGVALKPRKGDKVLGASALGPILVEGTRDGQRFIQTSFDPRHSDFVLRVAWPLFVLNSINYFIEEDTGYISSFKTGSVWRIPVASGAKEAKLSGPDGLETQIPVQQGRAVFFGTRAGFYELKTGTGPDEQVSAFAANLSDLEESRIQPKDALAVASVAAEPVSGFEAGVRRELWLYLLLAAILVSAIEWLTYHRRVTV